MPRQYWQRAPAVDDRCVDSEMLRPHYSMVLNWGRSELGVYRAVKTNQFVPMSVTVVGPAKTAEPIRVLFGLWAQMGQGNAC